MKITEFVDCPSSRRAALRVVAVRDRPGASSQSSSAEPVDAGGIQYPLLSIDTDIASALRSEVQSSTFISASVPARLRPSRLLRIRTCRTSRRGTLEHGDLALVAVERVVEHLHVA